MNKGQGNLTILTIVDESPSQEPCIPCIPNSQRRFERGPVQLFSLHKDLKNNEISTSNIKIKISGCILKCFRVFKKQVINHKGN